MFVVPKSTFREFLALNFVDMGLKLIESLSTAQKTPTNPEKAPSGGPEKRCSAKIDGRQSLTI